MPEEDILSSTKLVWSRMKVQIEPSAGTGVAVALGEEWRPETKVELNNMQGGTRLFLCGDSSCVDFLETIHQHLCRNPHPKFDINIWS